MGRGPNEEVDGVRFVSVDERRCGVPIDIVQPAADERKSLSAQIMHLGREVELAVKPRLDGMLIGGDHVDQMSRSHQRSYVARYNVVRDAITGSIRQRTDQPSDRCTDPHAPDRRTDHTLTHHDPGSGSRARR